GSRAQASAPQPRTCECQFLSLAGALSRAVSNTNSGVIDRPPLRIRFESRALSNIDLRRLRAVVTHACAETRIGWNRTTRVTFATVCCRIWEFATNRQQ